MSDQENCEKIARMCREILDTEEPFYWDFNLPERQKDYVIDYLLRAVLGFAERETKKQDFGDSLRYSTEKFGGGL